MDITEVSVSSVGEGRKRPNRRTLFVVFSSIFLLLVAIFWVGYLGSDDMSYWEGAVGWNTHFPYVASSHWSLRHPLVLPLAASRSIFGDGLLALAIPSLLYAVAFIALLAVWLRSALGAFAAAIALALVVTNPQFVLLASTADVDIPEMFFIFFAFFLMYSAISAKAGLEARTPALGKAALPWVKLASAGALLGFGAMSRETTVFAIAAVGVLFLVGYGLPRRAYFVIGLGFAIVTGLELVLFWIATGKLFYRYNIDLHHDSNINRWADQGAAIPFVHPLLDPVTMFLFNHNFALLSWIAIPLALWLIAHSKKLPAEGLRVVVLLGTLALVWALLAAGSWKILPLIPRYYLLPFIVLSVVAGIALARLWHDGRKRVCAALGALLLLGNLTALAIDNRNFMFGEYALIDLTSKSPETIHTDPLTLRRADLLLHWHGSFGRVQSTVPNSGDLYYYNPMRTELSQLQQSQWSVVEKERIPLNFSQRTICRILAVANISNGGAGRCKPRYVILYRVT